MPSLTGMFLALGMKWGGGVWGWGSQCPLSSLATQALGL